MERTFWSDLILPMGTNAGSSNRIMGGWWLSLLTAVVTVSGALQRVQLKTTATIRSN